MESNPFVTRWIDQVKQGDSDAAEKFGKSITNDLSAWRESA